MKKILDVITEEMEKGFESCGLNQNYAKVTVSNRPDLCEFQCNGAMALAKQLKMNPIEIAEKVAKAMESSQLFEEVVAVRPGFLNLKLSPKALTEYLQEMKNEKGRSI